MMTVAATAELSEYLDQKIKLLALSASCASRTNQWRRLQFILDT
jgi:hypothetical protein